MVAPGHAPVDRLCRVVGTPGAIEGLTQRQVLTVDHRLPDRACAHGAAADQWSVELALTRATAADATSAVATCDGDDGAGEYDASATGGAWIGTAATTPIRASHTSLLLPGFRCAWICP